MITEADAVGYFRSLKYNEQRRFYGLLAKYQKLPNYTLGFNIDSKGVKLLVKAVKFCEQLCIEYTSEKVNDTKVKLIFEGPEARNKVFIGIMGDNCVAVEDANLHCDETTEEEEE